MSEMGSFIRFILTENQAIILNIDLFLFWNSKYETI